jgi:hypothetical protein
MALALVAQPKDATEKREGDRDLKILARGVWPVRETKPAQRVIRNGEELALAHGIDPEHAREMRMQTAAAKDVAALLKVKGIDWSKQMLIVVAAGTKPTGGYSVEVLTLPVRERTLTVNWRLNSPSPDSAVTSALTYPAQMVLVERFTGQVKFDPPLKDR